MRVTMLEASTLSILNLNKEYSYECIYKYNSNKRRHPNKGLRWIKKKYFRSQDLRNWIFFAKRSDKRHNSNIDLFEASRVKIKRHIKIKAKATPFDPEFIKYLIDRNIDIDYHTFNNTDNPLLMSLVTDILNNQLKNHLPDEK